MVFYSLEREQAEFFYPRRLEMHVRPETAVAILNQMHSRSDMCGHHITKIKDGSQAECSRAFYSNAAGHHQAWYTIQSAVGCVSLQAVLHPVIVCLQRYRDI